MFGRFYAYHDTADVVERRKAIVTLHAKGWNVKSIAGYLKIGCHTVYRALDKWFAEGVLGLEDKPRGGVRKVNLRAMNEVRKLQENPEPGAFRISAALEQMGIPQSSNLRSYPCGESQTLRSRKAQARPQGE
jgi:transposase